ncbi:trimeric intracellular cation channel family protein [Leekyejoonella antrihumi]|uniref:Trimeric intracellular cation channel family protein n=1 Tax=Leekyejoonella antrihumi TaxID=1660198 RepID=A0A563DSX7_9MICO|nr:trimeric intracellular cation channel family protein [Leekyejoonella antrihumi]TWP32804.1 trimeric intracellular cation channel family protein [Leekyejoonella antrihumi]
MGHGELSELFRALDLTGVFANALLGGLIARQERLDPIGFATLAVLSGLGGGLIRDVLLQHGPPAALTDYAYLLTAFAGAAVSFAVRVEGPVWDRIWPVIDAVALGTWAAAGAQKTLTVGLGWLPAIFLGTITAVGGGAVRDVVLRRVPGVLGGNTLYATCAIAGSGVLVILSDHGHPTDGLVLATVVGAGLCLLARWRGWILPGADAWSPTRVVPARYRDRIRRRTARHGGRQLHRRTTSDDRTEPKERP